MRRALVALLTWTTTMTMNQGPTWVTWRSPPCTPMSTTTGLPLLMTTGRSWRWPLALQVFGFTLPLTYCWPPPSRQYHYPFWWWWWHGEELTLAIGPPGIWIYPLTYCWPPPSHHYHHPFWWWWWHGEELMLAISPLGIWIYPLTYCWPPPSHHYHHPFWWWWWPWGGVDTGH